MNQIEIATIWGKWKDWPFPYLGQFHQVQSPCEKVGSYEGYSFFLILLSRTEWTTTEPQKHVTLALSNTPFSVKRYKSYQEWPTFHQLSYWTANQHYSQNEGDFEEFPLRSQPTNFKLNILT